MAVLVAGQARRRAGVPDLCRGAPAFSQIGRGTQVGCQQAVVIDGGPGGRRERLQPRPRCSRVASCEFQFGSQPIQSALRTHAAGRRLLQQLRDAARRCHSCLCGQQLQLKGWQQRGAHRFHGFQGGGHAFEVTSFERQFQLRSAGALQDGAARPCLRSLDDGDRAFQLCLRKLVPARLGPGRCQIGIDAGRVRAGLTLPNRDCSGEPATRAAEVGCVRAIAGPLQAGGRRGRTRKRHPRETSFGGAVKAQQFSATFRDRITRVACRVRGAMGKEKRRSKILSPVVLRWLDPAHLPAVMHQIAATLAAR